MKGRELIGLDDSIGRLDAFDDVDQELKDRVFQRLQDNSELEASTGCVIYTGFWEANGQGKVRVGAHVRNLARATAWVYIEGFRIHGPERAVRTCDSPACCNPDHLMVVSSQAEAMKLQRFAGKLGDGTHRLTRAKAEALRVFVARGGSIDEAAKKFGIAARAVRYVIMGRTWPDKEGECVDGIVGLPQ